MISDTATRPTKDMLSAMASAIVGDEQRGEDPTTQALEERVADLLGQEMALFLPSGTMCNQISFLVHCRPGDEILCAENAHVFGSEGAGASALAGAQFRPIKAETGIFSGDDLRSCIRPLRHRSPRSRVVSVEQTTNRGGGSAWSTTEVSEIAKVAQDAGLALHMDGARALNAAVAMSVPASHFTQPCDSVWIDLTKGLGCPVGAVLAGSTGFIEEAWAWKHRLGGAMRQSGFLAAAGLYALEHNVDRLAEDHGNAQRFAEVISEVPGIRVAPEANFTNIVFVDLEPVGLFAEDLATALRESGIRVGVDSPHQLRVVTHLDVSREQVEHAARSAVAWIDDHQ